MNSSKKQKIQLPQNFQETLIEYEIRFDKGDRNVNLIKNLLFMYSVY